MKKTFKNFFAAALCIAVVAACDKPVEPVEPEVDHSEDPAELVSVGFYAADNADLGGDFVAEAIAPEMIIRIPGGGAGKNLVVKVAAGENDAVKVDDKKVGADSLATVDATFPIDIVVTDTLSNKSQTYVVKVGKILQTVWSLVGTYQDTQDKGKKLNGDISMAINPVTDEPWIVYNRYDTVGEAASKIRNLAVVKVVNGAFETVGTPGMGVEKNAYQLPKITFSPKGEAYISYVDANAGSYMTVRKFTTDWEVVGAAGFGTTDKPSTSYANGILVDPVSGTPACVWTGNTKTGVAYRSPAYATFNGTEWTAAAALPDYPTIDGSTNASMGCSAVYATDKAQYIAIAANAGSANVDGGYFVYKFANNSFTRVNKDPISWKYSYASTIGLAVDGEDVVYVFGANNENEEGYNNKLFKYTVSTNECVQVGSTVKTLLGASTGSNNALAISPEKVVYAAYANKVDAENKFGVRVASIDPETKDWTDWTVFEEGAAVYPSSTIQMAFNKKGECFVAYASKLDGSVNTLVVYKLALEADILPE